MGLQVTLSLAAFVRPAANQKQQPGKETISLKKGKGNDYNY